ncbi:hypothetical protein GS445_06165 [Rhodococcus hoagii]|nr:hypothetical protein [Prescottella equi]
MDVIAGAAYTYALGGFTTVIDGIVGPWMLDHFRTRAAQHPELAVHYIVLRHSAISRCSEPKPEPRRTL